MLQLSRLSGGLLAEYASSSSFPPRWSTMAELEREADRWVGALRRDRVERASWHRAGVLRARVDEALRSEDVEYFDREEVDPKEKLVLVRQLHLVNRILRAYDGFIAALRPHVERVWRREGRPARLLELASGSGELALALGALAGRAGLRVEVTGSDIVERYVEDASAKARDRGLDVRFVRLNAFDMTGLESGAYDLVFTAQSLHHFTPGQLAMMIAQSRRVAPGAFVAMDGYRSLSVLAATPLVGAVSLPRGARVAYMMWHDAVVSARKFLPASELELIARIAAPDDEVRTRRSLPYHSVLEVTPR